MLPIVVPQAQHADAQVKVLGIKKGTTSGGGTLDLTNSVLIGDGHSYVQGNGYTPFIEYTASHNPFLSNGSVYWNFGSGGQTTQDMLSDQTSQVFPKFTHGVVNILVVQCTGNYTYYYGDETQDVDYEFDYTDAARTYATTNGYTLIIIVLTSPHRDQTTAFGDNPTAFNAKIDNINTSIRTNYASHGIDAVLDEASWSELSSYTGGYYDADHVHLNQTGNNLAGQRLLDLILSMGLPFILAIVPRRRAKIISMNQKRAA